MTVYFISGLAADRGVFKYIKLPDGFEAVYLDWVTPRTTETLGEYAMRLSASIDPSKPFVLVGLSLGGMIATEIARNMKPEKLIIISSVPSPRHLPSYFKLAGRLRIHKLVPVSFFKTASIAKRFFTAESADDKRYIRRAIRESDPVFIKWAINAILNWRTDQNIECIHIHGSRDELLPVRFARPTHIIKGGGHLMVLNHYDEINGIIKDICVVNAP